MPKKFRVLVLFSIGWAAAQAQTSNPTVRFHTNLGDIDVVLTPSAAPVTVANFLSYVNAGAYNNSIFHRAVAGFVIQGGGYQLQSGNLQSGNAVVNAVTANPAIQNEFNATNATGTIAMALTSDSNNNPLPASATSQWFFNLANNGSQLDSGLFTVFGQIANASGLSVMNKIGALPTTDYSSVFGSAFSTLPLSSSNFVLVSSIVPIPGIIQAGFESAASFAQNINTGISPGEIITIYGQQLGPAQLTTFTVTNGAIPTSLAGTQVLFNGKPSPVLYTSAGQVSVVVPYGIAGLPSVSVAVSYQGESSGTLAFPVKPANPAIFTQNTSGTGEGVIVKFSGSTYTVISASNPASPGDVLTLYGEGYGAATSDTSLSDGTIVGSALPVLADPTRLLLIDNQSAITSYFGGAPFLVNGVLQVNFTVPVVAAGSHQIQLQVGTRTSPMGVTLHTK